MSYLVTTADGTQHWLVAIDAAAIEAYSSSANTRAALELAIVLGDYSTAPPIGASLGPNPPAFRAALASTPSWILWAGNIPAVLYVNLATAAAQDNWAEAQSIYQVAAAAHPPGPAAAEWQAIAAAHEMPITF